MNWHVIWLLSNLASFCVHLFAIYLIQVNHIKMWMIWMKLSMLYFSDIFRPLFIGHVFWWYSSDITKKAMNSVAKLWFKFWVNGMNESGHGILSLLNKGMRWGPNNKVIGLSAFVFSISELFSYPPSLLQHLQLTMHK